MTKKKKQKIIRLSRLASLVLGSILFVVLVGASFRHQKKVHCDQVEVVIDYGSGVSWIDEEEVMTIAEHITGGEVEGAEVSDVDFGGIEDALDQNPYIENAEVFATIDGELIIQIKQKQPVIRIINKAGVSFYLSEKGEPIPLSHKFTPQVPVASGWIEQGDAGIWIQKETAQSILHLNELIERDAFLASLIDQIWLTEEDEVELIPKFGCDLIELGAVDEMTSTKLENLKIFYQEGLTKVGWTKYQRINLKYEDQVICTKN